MVGRQTNGELAHRTSRRYGKCHNAYKHYQSDEWTVAKRYMGTESLAKARLRPLESEPDEPALAAAGAA